jgi:hypothetical protein
VGGTSAAAPLWASIADSYAYSAAGQVVRDVTSGNNDYTPSGYTGGRYPATRGYDMASGLGAPMVSGLSNHTWYIFLAGLNPSGAAPSPAGTATGTSDRPGHTYSCRRIQARVSQPQTGGR